jgi:hypothetical protein
MLISGTIRGGAAEAGGAATPVAAVTLALAELDAVGCDPGLALPVWAVADIEAEAAATLSTVKGGAATSGAAMRAAAASDAAAARARARLRKK